jgi:hypothetical protein
MGSASIGIATTLAAQQAEAQSHPVSGASGSGAESGVSAPAPAPW